MKKPHSVKKSFEIRPARKDELNLIQELAYEIWPAYYTTIISFDQIEYMLRNLYSLEALEGQVEGGSSFYLATEGEKAVGFLGLKKMSPEDLHIEKLYLLQSSRGKGYGKMLVEFAREEAKKQNCKYLTLNVNRFNESLWFYRALGFEVRKEVDIPLGPYLLTDFIMEKSPA